MERRKFHPVFRRNKNNVINKKSFKIFLINEILKSSECYENLRVVLDGYLRFLKRISQLF